MDQLTQFRLLVEECIESRDWLLIRFIDGEEMIFLPCGIGPARIEELDLIAWIATGIRYNRITAEESLTGLSLNHVRELSRCEAPPTTTD